jgi:hypothetical protein
MLLQTPENQDSVTSSLHRAWPSLVELAAGGDPGEAPPAQTCPLWSLYAPVAQGRGEPAFVIAQLGQSLDGRVATATGKSRYINGPEAIRHLHRLRALVDAVVVGVGTVIADDPQLNVREVEGPCPARVVIDPNFRLPVGARMLGDGAAPIYAIQGDGRPRLPPHPDRRRRGHGLGVPVGRGAAPVPPLHRSHRARLGAGGDQPAPHRRARRGLASRHRDPSIGRGCVV